jgi:sugar lactone lactonase YvrE
LLLLGLSLASAGSVADVGPASTIASGLANPRGIAFAPNGALYVVEAGRGGPGPCTFSPANPAIERCYGETGALSEILPNGGVRRVLTGLPSLAQPTGLVEGGPTDVAFLGTAAHVLLGWGGDPAIRATLGGKASMLGTLLKVTPSGQSHFVADLAGHEAITNPVGAPDSNPYGMAVLPGRTIVADAGANALVEVLANGRTRTFALPPPPPGARETVPTSVVEGPDGALYVGTLTSFPFFAGTAQVQRVESDGSSITVYASGFTAIVDVAFDAGGALYVLEVAAGQRPPFPPPNPGLGLGRLKRQCSVGAAAEVLLDGLLFPSGVAIGPDGAAYLTNFGVSATSGEVLRLPLAPCP